MHRVSDAKTMPWAEPTVNATNPPHIHRFSGGTKTKRLPLVRREPQTYDVKLVDYLQIISFWPLTM